jgi:hypothetical protein
MTERVVVIYGPLSELQKKLDAFTNELDHVRQNVIMVSAPAVVIPSISAERAVCAVTVLVEVGS